MVGHAFGRLDRGDIGVHQNGLDSLFPQGLEGLRATIVKFTGLADFQRTRPQDENFLHHSLEMNSSNKNSVSTGPPDASGWN